MTDFLLELRSEEIPARMQDKARDDLARLFAAELEKAGLKAGELTTYATPRRLALIARDLPAQTQAVREELKGPPADAPDAAIDGFLRKAGLTRDALETRDVKGRATLFAVIDRPGRATADVLAEAIPAIVRAFPWPKSMRWGAASESTESLRWVRPLQGIVALLGDAVVPVEVAGVLSGNATVGHRFHHPEPVAIAGAATYADQLRDAHVVVDQAERRNIIALGAKMAAQKAGLTLIEDEGLLIENAGLTEWPVPLLGRFDAAFLDVPPEVIQLSARVNQKYFVCSDAAGKLANAFVCTANIDAADGGTRIVEGNQKVLAARLSDARFFYETDRKVRLDDLRPKLEKIVFHEKLGTVADKVDRVAKLARWLVEQGIVKGANPAQVERAARLAKADLVTGMVGEFPELQGLMGGYYAAAQGEDAVVAEAVRDHYKPVGQGDAVPTAPVTVAVSLADKLDTILCFLSIDLQPSGSRDPFAIRRAFLATLALANRNGLRFSLRRVTEQWVAFAYQVMTGDFTRSQAENDAITVRNQELDQLFRTLVDGRFEHVRVEVTQRVRDMIQQAQTVGPTEWLELLNRGKEDGWRDLKNLMLSIALDRLKVQQREAGVRHDLIDAVFALGGEDDLVRLLARVHALQAFMAADDGANLLAGYKRAANILKKEGVSEAAWTAPAYAPDPAEAALIAALDAAGPKVETAVLAEDFEGAMAALATLRAPIDAFFTDVTVNDADRAKRESRLALLTRMRDAVHRVADFSRIEG